MRLLVLIMVSIFFIGCVPVKKGDFVTYKSDKYLFVNDTFISESMDCLELGEVSAGGLDAKYCVGFNYASQPVQGFIFEHKYNSLQKRYLGSTLTFQTKYLYTISCSTETQDESSSGIEYINCMVPKRQFDIYGFIISSENDVYGAFQTTLGSKKVYNGVIDKDGKALLINFYKNLQKKDSSKWKNRSL